MGSWIQTKRSAAMALGALLVASQATAAAERAAQQLGPVHLQFAAADTSVSPRIAVTGIGDRYQTVTKTALDLALQFSGEVGGADEHVRIVSSEVQFKGDAAWIAVAAAGGTTPVQRIYMTDTLKVPISESGPVAKAAIDACNDQSKTGARDRTTRASITVPLIWRVTAGRFSFKWTAYDIVAPTEAIYNDANFYADRESHDAEILMTLDVDCLPLAKTTASKANEKSPRTASTAKAAQKASFVAPASSIACTGGMVRQSTSSEEICLCPGNTRRVQGPTDDVTCVRRTKRL